MLPSSCTPAPISAATACLIRLVTRWASLDARHARPSLLRVLCTLVRTLGPRISRLRGTLVSRAGPVARAIGRPVVPLPGIRGYATAALVVAVGVTGAMMTTQHNTAQDGLAAQHSSVLSAPGQQMAPQLLSNPQERVLAPAATVAQQAGTQQQQARQGGQAAGSQYGTQGPAQQAAPRNAQHGANGSRGASPKAAAPAKAAAPVNVWDQLTPAPLSSPQQAMPIGGSQMANAKVIFQTAVGMHMGYRSAVIAVATAMQESQLENLDYGDQDSLGLFQQRPSAGWGSPGQITDPRYAAGAFLSALHQYQVSNPGWATQPLWMAAQGVQDSAFPTAYEVWDQQAASIVHQLGGLVPRKGDVSGPSAHHGRRARPCPVSRRAQVAARWSPESGAIR